MPNKPLPLEKILEILALHIEGYGLRRIMKKTGASDTAVRKYRKIYDEAVRELKEKWGY